MHFHPPIMEATLLSNHAIAESTINITRHKSGILLHLGMAKLIILNSKRLMKRLFRVYEGKNAVTLTAE